MPNPYVYCVKNKFTNEFYFGYRSANKEVAAADLGVKYFTSSRKVKDKFHEFDITLLTECTSVEEAFRLEQQYIADNWDDPLLLNENYHKPGGKVFRNTIESHKVQAEKIRGRKQSKEHIEKRFESYFKNNGKKEPKQNKYASKEEYHAALSQRFLGENNPNYGNHWDEEKRLEASKKKQLHFKENPATQETREKISKAHKGKLGKFDYLNKTRKTCEHCGYETTLAAFNHYHKICPKSLEKESI